MARLDWVHSRLKNWERWHCQQRAGGLGFATQAVFLNEFPGADRVSRIPIDEVEASITNDAVEALKQPRPVLYQTLFLVYPLGLGPAGTAKRLGCHPSNIHANLGVADRVLAAWFTERAEKQAKLQADIKQAYARARGFTT